MKIFFSQSLRIQKWALYFLYLPKETSSTSYLTIIEVALAYSSPYPGKTAVEQYNSWGRETITTLLYCFRCFTLTLICPQMICKITLNNNLIESLSLGIYFRHIACHVSVTEVCVLYTQSNANTFCFILQMHSYFKSTMWTNVISFLFK